MSFVLTRFKERIIVDKPFAESLANELRSSQRTDGTILLVAEEILLDPSYEFNYNNADVNFLGRYDLILVADQFDSRGGKIDLTGSRGSNGTDGHRGANGEGTVNHPSTNSENTSGKPGTPGIPPDRIGGDGKNIKVLCD